ncbi:MAG TPA: thioredoxin family protein [Bacteroidales bacterium]|nr:thioredoxin family protein [Bacteroidales bacterium]
MVSFSLLSVLLCVASLQFSSCSNNPGQKYKNGNADVKDTLVSVNDSIRALYDYSSSHLSYKLTWLEFGSQGCVPCKRMERVMDSVKAAYSSTVNVVFYDVRDKKNKVIVNHFEIRMIPVQVLLDRNGKEYYRHIGYFSFDSLANKFNERLHHL